MSSSSALNSSELKGSPCLTPLSMLNSLLTLSVLTVAVWLEYSDWSRSMYCGGTRCLRKVCQSLSWHMVSNAFLKSYGIYV